jgi:tetratricopeptide (TPR) repeat protein
MKFYRLLAVCSALASAVVTAPAAAQSNGYALTRARTLYAQLRDDAQCEAALPTAREFWPASEFRTLPVDVQQAFLYATMSCAWSLRDGAAAIAAAGAAHELGAPWTAYARMQLGLAFDDNALATRGFFEFAEQNPEGFAQMPGRFVFGSLRAAGEVDPSDATALRMHDKLIALNYADPEGQPDDALRVNHARLLLRHGQVERARERLATVVDPRSVLLMRVNRLYDPLRGDAAFEQRLDLVAAAEASLTRSRRLVQEQPRSLGAVLGLAQDLRTLGRTEEALAELDRALTVAQAAGGAASFDDTEDKLNWLLNEKAYALYDLNRADEARAVFGNSIAVGEHGNWSVSQVINFAQSLETEGRGADALEVLRTVGEASAYGDMWTASVRACAADQTGDTAARDQALAFLREHRDDNVAALTRALICVNDLDGVAALFIERLNDQDDREGALIALQQFRQLETRQMPRETLLMERLAQVRNRPDVQAAVGAVGRIENIPLFATYWGDV